MGPTLSILRLVKHLDRSIFTPIILVPDDAPFLPGYEDRELEVIRWPKRATFFRNIDILRIAALVIRRNIDIVHVNSRVIPLAAFAAGISPAKSIWHLREIFSSKPSFNWRMASKLVDYFIFNSEEGSRSLRQYLPVKRYQVLYNGVDVSPAPIPIPVRDEAKILMVSNIQPQKGQDYLLSAFFSLSREYPHLSLHFVGSCFNEWQYYLQDMKKRIVDSGLTGRIIFHGFHPDPGHFVDDSDIVVHTSLEESFGNVIIEAMSRGRPVVSFAVGGVREIITDGQNGYLVDKGDIDALQGRIRELIRDRTLRDSMGKRAHHEMVRRFQAKQKADEFMKLCNLLITD